MIGEGEFVRLDSGKMVRVAGGHDNVLRVEQMYSAEELENRNILPAGRTLDSFASNELVLGLATTDISIQSVVERVTVLSFEQVLLGHTHGDFLFYRQVVEDNSVAWRLEPPIECKVATYPPSVENPESVYHYCECSGGRKLYPTRDGRQRSKIGDVHSGYVLFVCPTCQSTRHQSEEVKVKDGGLQWLKSSERAETPSDPKREVIIKKFVSGLKIGLDSNSTAPLAKESIINEFCTALEHEIHNAFVDKPREYKARVFTLTFNLSDTKNVSLRRRILEGQFSPHELASDDIQEITKEQLDKYYQTHVVKRKEDVGQPGEPAKKPKMAEEPEVKPPPAGVTAASPVPAKPVENVIRPVQVVMPHFAPPVVGEVAWSSDPAPAESTRRHMGENSGAHELLDLAEQLKASLNTLSSEPLRKHFNMFVDYYVRHIHP